MSMNIVIFGTGIFYLRRKDMLPNQTTIVAFLDNNSRLQGKFLDGALIYNPIDVSKLSYDMIILASASAIEMRKQLLSLDVPEEKIIFWEEFISNNSHGILIKYNAENKIIEEKQKQVLLIVPIINYAGGFMTALSVAMVLQSNDYHVVITAPTANNKTVSEVNKYGIDVWLCPSLPYIDEELEWIQKFDFVIVNSLQNMICASRISGKVPVMWWLHENKCQYEGIVGQYEKQIDVSAIKKVDIYAVSNLARRFFEEFYSNVKVKKLILGAPDFYDGQIYPVYNNKIVIALIGTIVHRKNQIGFINAIKKLPDHVKRKIECWIIGKDGGRDYRQEVDRLVQNSPEIEVCGEFSREEIIKAFSKIDIVVCLSFEETMSIAIVEGMMNKKICITNDNTGVAEFIRNGENGFVYEAGNEEEFLTKLIYTIQNFDKLDYMRNKARETYEEFFSMKVFSKNIKEIVEKNIVYKE